ncbi:mandelate racemase/muconate lactonizing protein-like protein [Venturia nashicola]|uniref:Mandelate racemase/muconate lactonizing protein-like protein n=1 Tax=Venturia nashicola TaxID=86259 RepID=A0A4Z1P4F4_9PEZI|nr:mandelate racemase/muconate lactonizing protein-like protein [Venturia nashicola]
MAKITSIEYFRVPPRWLFVKITDEHGNGGWGEASLEGHTQAVEGCLDAWRTRYTGLEADEIEQIWQLSWRAGFYRGGPVFMSALAGIDIALWDLKARKLGVPIYQLLGGKVRDKLKVYAWIGGDRPGDVEEQALARKSQGFDAVKMNATESLGWLDSPAALDSCVDRLKAVKALGMDAGVDFHGRVHKPMAKQLAKALEPHRPLFIEEPCLSEHIDAISSLAKQTSIPIALGERLHSRWDIRPFLEAGCVDILQPDISHVGGISEMRRIATACETYDVALAPHCPLGPIALAACVQVDAVSANFAIQEMSLGIHYNVGGRDLTSYTLNPEVWKVDDGYIELPSGPGLGIEIDEEEVRRVAEGAVPWVSPSFVGPGAGISVAIAKPLELLVNDAAACVVPRPLPLVPELVLNPISVPINIVVKPLALYKPIVPPLPLPPSTVVKASTPPSPVPVTTLDAPSIPPTPAAPFNSPTLLSRLAIFAEYCVGTAEIHSGIVDAVRAEARRDATSPVSVCCGGGGERGVDGGRDVEGD